jgi:NADH:ubiquinone oxidoreductase subunit 3 (subunit A)
VASRSPAGVDAAVADGLVSSRGLVFAGAMLFTALVIVGFAYDWRKGVFRWR